MASVKPRPGYGYEVRYIDPATGKRPSKTFKLKKDADSFKRKVEREIEDGEHVSPHLAVTVAEAAAEYIRHLEGQLDDKAIGQSHFQRERNAIRKWMLPEIGRKRFKEVTSSDAHNIYRKMLAAGLKHKTAKSYLFAMRLLETWSKASARKWTRTSAFEEAMGEIKIPGVKGVRTFTPCDVATLLRVASERVARGQQRHVVLMECCVGLAALCGLRVGEIIALAPEDIDLGKQLIRVGHNLTQWGERKSPKTRAGVRTVSIPDRLVGPLSTWLNDHRVANPLDLVFTRRDGAFISHSGIRGGWRDLLRRAGLAAADKDHYHFHALRHFHASWLLQNNVPVADVSRLMGHANAAITLRIYTHAMLDAEAAQRHINRTVALLPDARVTQIALSA